MGLSEKSGSPFCVLQMVEGIAKNGVGGAKTVSKTKLQRIWLFTGVSFTVISSLYVSNNSF